MSLPFTNSYDQRLFAIGPNIFLLTNQNYLNKDFMAITKNRTGS